MPHWSVAKCAMPWKRNELINLSKRSDGVNELSQMTCTEWTTILVNSQTRKHPPLPNSQPIHSQTNTLVNSLTCQLVDLKHCQLFSINFNIMSTLFVHHSPTLPQKIDSREGCFWCQKGVVCKCNKMYFYLKKSPFAPVFGLFVAKCSAICR